MIPDFPIDIRIILAELNFFLLLPDFANSLPCWLSQQNWIPNNLGFIVSDLPYLSKPKELNFVHIQFAISNKFMQINEITLLLL